MSSTAPSGDADLVERAARGDERAVAQLYDRYAAMLYAVAYRILRRPVDAEEVVAEAFAQAWREAGRFEAGRGSVPAWLTMMARSRAFDLARGLVRRDRLATGAAALADDPPGVGAWQSDPETEYDTAERGRQVRLALDQLSEPQRQAIELAYYEGLSQSEIAARLNQPLGTIKTRVRAAMLKLRDALRPYFYEQPQ